MHTYWIRLYCVVREILPKWKLRKINLSLPICYYCFCLKSFIFFSSFFSSVQINLTVVPKPASLSIVKLKWKLKKGYFSKNESQRWETGGKEKRGEREICIHREYTENKLWNINKSLTPYWKRGEENRIIYYQKKNERKKKIHKNKMRKKKNQG